MRLFHINPRERRASRERTLNGASSMSRLSSNSPRPSVDGLLTPTFSSRPRSMSIAFSPDSAEGDSSYRRYRSHSVCQQSQRTPRKSLSRMTEEEDTFQGFTVKLYIILGTLCTAMAGFVIYAYLYNTGKYHQKVLILLLKKKQKNMVTVRRLNWFIVFHLRSY